MPGCRPAAQLPAGKWQPGVNYDPVVPAQPTNVAPGKVEVMEVFWLACPHCYDLEPYHAQLAEDQAGVRGVRARAGHVAARSTARMHGCTTRSMPSAGRTCFRRRSTPSTSSRSARSRRCSATATQQTFRLQQSSPCRTASAPTISPRPTTPSGELPLQRAEELTQRYQVQGVPFIAVNGKYTTDVVKAGGEAKLIELINDLAAAEHGH